MSKRHAHRLFTDLPELVRSNSCMVIIDENEGEGRFMLHEGAMLVSIELHSLNNSKFRKNAINKLQSIKEVVERGLAYIEMLEPLKDEGQYPPLMPKSE